MLSSKARKRIAKEKNINEEMQDGSRDKKGENFFWTTHTRLQGKNGRIRERSRELNIQNNENMRRQIQRARKVKNAMTLNWESNLLASRLFFVTFGAFCEWIS